jgi:hypothetical protein
MARAIQTVSDLRERAAIIHQPFAGAEGKALLGRRAFGLPVYVSPRFV